MQAHIRMTEVEKNELLKKVLGRDYVTAGKNLPVLKKMIDKIGKVAIFYQWQTLYLR